MEEYTKYMKRAKDLGVKNAKIISTKSIVTAEWVRLKCQFGCGGYGRTLTCPPYSPTPEKKRLTDHFGIAYCAGTRQVYAGLGSGRSVARLARVVRVHEVVSSNLTAPTN